ncbi:MAG TPA: copper amine oxidase N-terminal domain-containing protein [Firmicutes bacterium]|nr:copper amine oxidase N-terminal domain-containing protein [Bacillota bacterium]
MKKQLLVLTLVLLLTTTVIAAARALAPIIIVVNGSPLETDVAPVLTQGRVLAPVRAIAEKLGAEVIWDGENNTVYINTITKDGELEEKDAEAEVTAVVETFGARLQMVSLLAPEDILAQSMEENYGDLVAPGLLEEWLREPAKAPGRQLSSPWPERIEINALEKTAPNRYQVRGEIIEVTSAEVAGGGIAARRPINLVVEKVGNSWLITAFTLGDYEEAGTIIYDNDEYGFRFTLPESWAGYTIVTEEWEGLNPEAPGEIAARGPIISIRHPRWTAERPRQDIPIMVFTHAQWEAMEQGAFHIGAAPIGPRELDRNGKYVFALPARYNFAFPEGYEEVEAILETNPLQANENYS